MANLVAWPEAAHRAQCPKEQSCPQPLAIFGHILQWLWNGRACSSLPDSQFGRVRRLFVFVREGKLQGQAPLPKRAPHHVARSAVNHGKRAQRALPVSRHGGSGEWSRPLHCAQACKLDEERCPTLICAGYSCKNLSKLNCNPKEFVLRSATGSSGETAQALLKYLNDWRPAVALLENVEEMAREADESDNVSYFLEELEKLGYAMATKLLDSSHYGMAAIRRRAWQVVLSRSAFQSDNKELDKAAQDIVQMACGLAIGSWPLEDFLLSNDHDLVQQEFQRRVQTSGRGSIAAQEGWKAQHREFFQSKGIPWTAVQVPAAVRESPWYVFLTERGRALNNGSFCRPDSFCLPLPGSEMPLAALTLTLAA